MSGRGRRIHDRQQARAIFKRNFDNAELLEKTISNLIELTEQRANNFESFTRAQMRTHPDKGAIVRLAEDVYNHQTLMTLVLASLLDQSKRLRTELKSAIDAVREGNMKRLEDLRKEMDSMRVLRKDEEWVLKLAMPLAKKTFEDKAKKGTLPF